MCRKENKHIVEKIRMYAELDSACAVFCFYQEHDVISMTFKEIDARARQIAAEIQSREISHLPILILLEPGLEYICALLGCLYAGAIAVPCSPPRNKRHHERPINIIKNADIKYVLTSTTIRKLPTNTDLQLIYIDNLFRTAEEYIETRIENDDIALLQYTSGSTGSPKGVILSHTNIIANLYLQQSFFDFREQSVGCSWLPPYHDMGLIGGILFPLYFNHVMHLFTPQHFLQNPLRWLQCISDNKVEMSPAPNFAYDLCYESISDEALESLDLSSWAFALSGSEPIKSETMNRFIEKFKVCGFNPNAFYPAYGLAESTLMVSGKKKLTQTNLHKKKNIEHVSCGKPGLDLDVQIVDTQNNTVQLPEQEGEIWIQGSSVSKGYWNGDNTTFQGTLKNKHKQYYCTGDMGFYNKEGELFVTGRLKEMFIVRGANFYPQDIENVCCMADNNLIKNATAAFQAASDSSGFIIACEVMRHFKDYVSVVNNILAAVTEKFNIRPNEIILLRLGSIPKTTSGKTRRLETCRLVHQNELKVLYHWRAQEKKVVSPSAPLTQAFPPQYSRSWLDDWLQEACGLGDFVITDKLALRTLGLDSIQWSHLHRELYQLFEINIAFDKLFECTTVIELHLLLTKYEKCQPNKTERSHVLTSQEISILKFDKDSQAHWFNMPFILGLEGSFDLRRLEQSVNQLVSYHEILRTTYHKSKKEWVKQIHDKLSYDVIQHDLTHFNKRDQIEIIKGYCFFYEKYAFQYELLPLFKIILFKKGQSSYSLLFVFSHLIMDGKSVYNFISQLSSIYNKMSLGAPAPILFSSQYAEFAHRQLERTTTAEDADSEKYWKNKIELLSYMKEGEWCRSDLRGTASANQSNLCVTHIAKLPTKLSQKMNQYASENNVSVYSIYHAAFAILIRMLINDDIIHFKSLYMNRAHPGEHDALGFLASGTLNIAKIEPNLMAKQWIQECHEDIKLNIKHISYPYDTLLAKNTKLKGLKIPAFCLNFNNYLAPISFQNCKMRLMPHFFKDNLMWGDSVTFVLHIYSVNEQSYVRFRGHAEYYTDSVLSQCAVQMNTIINQLLVLPNGYVKDCMTKNTLSLTKCFD